MSQATPGFSRVTHTHTCQNLYPHPWAQVFMGTGQGFTKTHGYPNPCEVVPSEMTNEPRKGSASVNGHCCANLARIGKSSVGFLGLWVVSWVFSWAVSRNLRVEFARGGRGGVDVGVVIVFAVGWGGLVLVMFVPRFALLGQCSQHGMRWKGH